MCIRRSLQRTLLTVPLVVFATTLPAQELKKQPGIKEDRDALCGTGLVAWEFQKKDAAGLVVRLFFTKGADGKPDHGLVMHGSGGFILSLGFEFALEDKEGKRQIKVTPGTAFDAKGSDPVLPYKLDGDKLQLFGGKDGDFDLKGEWKRVKLK